MTKDIGKPTQAEKQAFWAEQMPDFKANYICQSQLDALEFNNKTGNFDALTKDETGFELEDILESYHSVNTGWSMWLKAKAHEAEKLKGCVVVPKDQIEVWWQDAEEPENFATQSKDLHFIADGLEDGDIMKIHEHHTIHMPSNTLYGAWIYKDGERIFITGTKTDVEAARGGNE